ncbi:hypothetical protein D3C74_366330 [compost metagenome]
MILVVIIMISIVIGVPAKITPSCDEKNKLSALTTYEFPCWTIPLIYRLLKLFSPIPANSIMLPPSSFVNDVAGIITEADKSRSVSGK